MFDCEESKVLLTAESGNYRKGKSRISEMVRGSTMRCKLTKLQLIFLSLLTVCLFGRILIDVSLAETTKTVSVFPAGEGGGSDIARIAPKTGEGIQPPESTQKPRKTQNLANKGMYKGYPVIVDESWNRESLEDLVSRSRHPKTISTLVGCESQWVDIARVDSNGYYSRGILQFQSSTWNGWVASSGIHGDPMNPLDAIRMADWAIDNGLLSHWSCSYITGLLNRNG